MIMRIGAVILGTVSQLVLNPRLLRNCIKGTTMDRQNGDVIKWALTGKQCTDAPQIEDLIATLGVVVCETGGSSIQGHSLLHGDF